MSAVDKDHKMTINVTANGSSKRPLSGFVLQIKKKFRKEVKHQTMPLIS